MTLEATHHATDIMHILCMLVGLVWFGSQYNDRKNEEQRKTRRASSGQRAPHPKKRSVKVQGGNAKAKTRRVKVKKAKPLSAWDQRIFDEYFFKSRFVTAQ